MWEQLLRMQNWKCGIGSHPREEGSGEEGREEGSGEAVHTREGSVGKGEQRPRTDP